MAYFFYVRTQFKEKIEIAFYLRTPFVASLLVLLYGNTTSQLMIIITLQCFTVFRTVKLKQTYRVINVCFEGMCLLTIVTTLFDYTSKEMSNARDGYICVGMMVSTIIVEVIGLLVKGIMWLKTKKSHIPLTK